MRLQDFLKCKKVRYVNGDNYKGLTDGEIYEVIGATHSRIKVKNDEGVDGWFDSHHFEPVLDDTEIDTSADSVDNCQAPHVSSPSNDDAPHVSERPYFEAGQKAYCPWLNEGKLVLLEANHITDLFAETAKGRQYFNEDGTSIEVRRPAQPDLFHATPENHELLSKLMPWLDFEVPPKPLTGSDLCRAMLDKGWRYVPCYISDSDDEHALERNPRNAVVINGIDADHPSFFVYGKSYIHHAVPFDPKTGEPLTEAVLDE